MKISTGEKEILEELRRDADESAVLFSGRGKKDLEKRAVRGFLRAVGVTFLEEELQSGQVEPIDVCFRGARVQVTERPEPGSRPNLEWRQVAERRHEAMCLEELKDPYTPSRPIGPDAVAKLALQAATGKWDRYRNTGCAGVDLLVYINLQDRHLHPKSPWPDIANFREQGWRSVSLLIGFTSVVLFASNDAPEFLRSSVRQSMQEWHPADPLFDP